MVRKTLLTNSLQEERKKHIKKGKPKERKEEEEEQKEKGKGGGNPTKEDAPKRNKIYFFN